MKRFLIIGGGAAGMLASVYAARNGMEVHLFEQNEKLGKKLFITGKGRCNFTNGCATEELFESFITNPRFLYSAVYGYTNYDVIDFFETAGVKTKMERGGRMFPMSDHSSDIIRALEQQMKKAGAFKEYAGEFWTVETKLARSQRFLWKKKRTEMQGSPESSWITEKRSGANRYWLPLAVILIRPQAPPGTDTGWQKRVVIP